MSHIVTKIFILLLAASVLISPIAGAETYGTTVSLTIPQNPPPSTPSLGDIESKLFISATKVVTDAGGYKVDGVLGVTEVTFNGYGGTRVIKPVNIPENAYLIVTYTINGQSVTRGYKDGFFTFKLSEHSKSMNVHLLLDFYIESSDDEGGDSTEGGSGSGQNPGTGGGNENEGGNEGGSGSGQTPGDEGGDSTEGGSGSGQNPGTGGGNENEGGNEGGDDSGQTPGDEGGDNPSVKPNYPSMPDVPSNPDTPVTPSTPSEPENPYTPDTPGSDTPGSDEPYLPILPPAGSVYNLAGFIPLLAGFLLLFLVFFWRRKVYRILKSHAKKHGEKPEKEHLKEIADAIIKLVRDEGRYPEWKKNSDVAKRLSADIVSVLDEMNYARAVPRGALVAEIIKAARGRINRHRL